MAKSTNIKIFLLVLFGTSQILISVSVQQEVVVERLKTKRSKADTSTNEPYDTSEGTIEDMCGPPPSDSPSVRRRKRSEQQRLFNASAAENQTSEMTPKAVVDYSYLSAEFTSCTHLPLERECFEERQDGTVYVPVYNRVFPKSDYLIRDDTLFICPDFFPNTPDHISIISIVGSSVSIACLVLHIIVYVSIRTTKNLPSRCLLSLCISLLLAYVLTFVQQAANDDESCRVVGMFMVYFFLAAFFWMNVFSYDVWRSIRLATTKLRMTNDRPMMVRFARYSVYAWGSPLLFSLLSIIIHNSTENIKFKLVFDINFCWFAYKQALALYFVGPLFTLLGINILLTLSSFYMISTASMKDNSGKESFDLRARLCLSLRLGSSMGLTWVFGVLAVATLQEWLWCLFAICSALQGVFIFLSFTVSERSRKEWKKVLRSRKSSANPTQTTSSNPVTSV